MVTPVPDLIYGALAEIRVARGGDVVRADDQALCLTFLNEGLERLAVMPHGLFGQISVSFPLTPGLAQHTIGPTGVWIMARPPVRIRAALLILPGTTTVEIPLQSERWYLTRTQPALQSPIPQGLYYARSWPDAAVALWPVPSLPYYVTLDVDQQLVLPVALTDVIDLPQGYGELLRLWTAKKAAPSFAREFSAASQQALTECLADVFGTNVGRVNDADTRDGGVPGGRGGTYDYRTGLVS
jgi:hypothetical protein